MNLDLADVAAGKSARLARERAQDVAGTQLVLAAAGDAQRLHGRVGCPATWACACRLRPRPSAGAPPDAPAALRALPRSPSPWRDPGGRPATPPVPPCRRVPCGRCDGRRSPAETAARSSPPGPARRCPGRAPRRPSPPARAVLWLRNFAITKSRSLCSRLPCRLAQLKPAARSVSSTRATVALKLQKTMVDAGADSGGLAAVSPATWRGARRRPDRPRRRPAGARAPGTLRFSDGQALGIVLMRLGHRVDRPRIGGREEDRLPRLRRSGQDLLHLDAKAHLQHAVGLVDDDGRDAAQIQRSRARCGRGPGPAFRRPRGRPAPAPPAGALSAVRPRRSERRGPLHAAPACGARAPPACTARAWDRGSGPAGGVRSSSASARSPGRRPPSCRCRCWTVRSGPGPPAAAEWPAPGPALAWRTPARPSPDTSWRTARARRTPCQLREQAPIGASSWSLITNRAKKVHGISSEIDAAPVDCRAIWIGGCFVVVEGVCVTAVAIKWVAVKRR